MIKALFKKQMMEVFSWVYQDKRSGKNRTIGSAIAFSLLYLFLFGFLASVFYFAASALCNPLCDLGLGWMYWCLMSLIAIFFGVFGSVFNTYSSLYCAKDNDILLSMPIPPRLIILMRLSGVYAIGLMYELIIMIPTLIVWFLTADISIIGVISAVLIPIVLSIWVLLLSAVFGYVVALIVSRLKRKNIITVILSLLFIVGYYYLYGRAYEILQLMLANAEAVGAKLKLFVFPLYHMGLAADGSIASLLIFIGISAAAALIVYALMAHSFISVATTARGSARSSRKYKLGQKRSVHAVLLRKELARFFGSANYMLNCGIGIIMMPIAAVAVIIKADDLRSVFSSLDLLSGAMPVLAAAAVFMLSSMIDISAPSISLEGKSIWIIRSLPVSERQILLAKLECHFLLALLPSLPLIAALLILIRPNALVAVLLPIAAMLFILLSATAGLMLNLRFPNLNWTNEVIPIKQSLPVTLALFGGWVLTAILMLPFFLMGGMISSTLYLFAEVLLLALLDAVLLFRLMTCGADILAKL